MNEEALKDFLENQVFKPAKDVPKGVVTVELRDSEDDRLIFKGKGSELHKLLFSNKPPEGTHKGTLYQLTTLINDKHHATMYAQIITLRAMFRPDKKEKQTNGKTT